MATHNNKGLVQTLLVNNNTEHDSDVRRHIENHIVNRRQNEEKKTKERHIAKLDRLKKKQQAKFVDKKNTELNLSGTNLKKWRERWVKNLSEKDLTDPQESLLARGLGFAVSVNKIPHDEFIVACESACAKLPPGEAQNLRMEVAGSLKTAKIPTSNITKEEKRQKELQKSKDLLIMGADKGKCTVVQTIQSYESKVETMLSDTKTYEKLKKDPTPTYKRKLIGMLQKLKAEKKIEEGQYRLLYPTAENTPRLYCTTKIHKQGDPIRPIVDYIGSIGYQTSKALAEILSPLVGTTEHHVTNSKQLAEELTGVLIDDGDIFNSHDVVSLFTNTPIDKTLEIIRDRLTKDTTLPERTRLNATDIMELLEFILTTTYFSFRGNIYRQKFGAAMGSPVSAIVANLYMEWLEQQAIATAPLDCAPKYWRRYVDDVLEVIRKDTTEKLTDHLNKVDETGNIKFTYEEEKDCSIPFLDTLVVRKQDGSIKLLIYRKKTHTDQYLNFDSQHPLHQKLGVIRTLFDRMDSIVTEEEDKKEEEKKIRTALQNCGYGAIQGGQWTVLSSKCQQVRSRVTVQRRALMITRQRVW
ncbi:uncharacterized protein [Amphiura filiformis]|uniref:uncharacterized protein n=1 Tax=Amphiura filiformis TaxID=82378 RepID=UPI003B20C252